MTAIKNPALYAFDIPAAGPAVPVTGDLDQPAPANTAFRWIHLDLGVPGVREWISARVDPVVAHALTHEDTRPRCARHAGGLILILRGVNLNPGSDPEDMVSIRMWIDQDRIISVRIRRLMAVVALRETLEAGTGPRTVGGFVAALAAGLTERMNPVITGLGDIVDDLEERSIEQPDGLRGDLADLRRETIMLRRYIAPQRDALMRLETDAVGLFDDAAGISVRESVDRVTRMVEEMDLIRERSAVLYDQISDRRAEEMNRNMLVLSVVAAVFLPLGFLTGLLGVNIAGIPGADYPFAFLMFCIALVAIAGGLLWFFRKLKWI